MKLCRKEGLDAFKRMVVVPLWLVRESVTGYRDKLVVLQGRTKSNAAGEGSIREGTGYQHYIGVHIGSSSC